MEKNCSPYFSRMTALLIILLILELITNVAVPVNAPLKLALIVDPFVQSDKVCYNYINNDSALICT